MPSVPRTRAPLFWVLPRPFQGPCILCGAPAGERESLNAEPDQQKDPDTGRGPEGKRNPFAFFSGGRESFYTKIPRILWIRWRIVLHRD